MKSFIIFSAIIAITLAIDGTVDVTEDTLGNYKLNLRTDDVNRAETRTADGKVVGSYSFTDNDGKPHTVTYVASEQGFQVSGSHLPQSVPEGPEIVKARSEHLAAVAAESAL